jgi:transposase
MKLSELLLIIQDEKKSEDYLRCVGILKTFSNCPRCNGTSLGMIRGDRWKCYKCKTEWTRRKDSILSLVRIKYSEFQLCLKLFELEITVEKTAEQLGINYKTINLLFNEIRRHILGYSTDQINEIKIIMKGSSDFISVNSIDNKIVFGFNKEVDENSSIFTLKRTRIPNSAASYNLSYNRLRNFIQVGRGVGYFSNMDRFWRYAKESLIKFRGTDYKNFLLYLKEVEFRFNNSDKELFDIICEKIAQNDEVVR